MRRCFVPLALGIVVAVGVTAGVAAAGSSLSQLGCCAYRYLPPGGQQPVTDCAVVTEDQCRGDGSIAFERIEFSELSTCNAASDGCEPFVSPGILTTASLARLPKDCFGSDAFPVLSVDPGQPVSVCAGICNYTNDSLRYFTLFIDPFALPEFENSFGFLPEDRCSLAVKTVLTGDLQKNFTGPSPLTVTNTWCAADASMPYGVCNPTNSSGDGSLGGAAGPAEPLFTDAQHALLFLGALHGAPALDVWGLNLLTLALVGFGVWRLARSVRRSRH